MPRTRLRPDQDRVREELKARPRSLLIAPPGWGKTPLSLRWAFDRARFPRYEHLHLAIVPNLGGAGPRHWKRQAERWANYRDIVVAPRDRQARHLLWREIRTFLNCPDWESLVIATYEQVRSDIELVRAIPWNLLIVDEAHRIKDRRAQQSKAVASLARVADSVLLMTGTPIINRLDELWHLLHVLDPGRFRSYWRWVDQWCAMSVRSFGSRTVRQVIGPRPPVDQTLARLSSEISDLVLQEQEVRGQGLEQIILPIELSGPERRIYDQLRRHMWLSAQETGGEDLAVWSPGALVTRLRQLVSDWTSLIETEASASKIKAALDLVVKGDLSDEPVLILTAFRSSAETLHRQIPGSVLYHGGTSHEGRASALEAFTSGKARALVGTIAALGEGIDGLQHRAHHIVFLDRDWSPARMDQALGRLVREGQEHQVTAWHIVARDTIDETVAQALVEKRDLAQALRQALQSD